MPLGSTSDSWATRGDGFSSSAHWIHTTQELVRATGWRFESSLPHQDLRARKDGLSFTFALLLCAIGSGSTGSDEVRRKCDVAGQRGLTHCGAHTSSALDATRRYSRLSPKLSVWGILGSTCPRAVVTFYAGVDYSRFSRSRVHAVGGTSGGALRVSMQHDSAVDAGHRECARSMAITSAFRALASGVLCEMLRGMALVEALGLRTTKPRRDLSDVMNSVSLGD